LANLLLSRLHELLADQWSQVLWLQGVQLLLLLLRLNHL